MKKLFHKKGGIDKKPFQISYYVNIKKYKINVVIYKDIVNVREFPFQIKILSTSGLFDVSPKHRVVFKNIGREI